jgi:hypothetical protein
MTRHGSGVTSDDSYPPFSCRGRRPFKRVTRGHAGTIECFIEIRLWQRDVMSVSVRVLPSLWSTKGGVSSCVTCCMCYNLGAVSVWFVSPRIRSTETAGTGCVYCCFFLLPISTFSSLAKRFPRFPTQAWTALRETLSTVNRKHYCMSILCTESFCTQKLAA